MRLGLCCEHRSAVLQLWLHSETVRVCARYKLFFYDSDYYDSNWNMTAVGRTILDYDVITIW